MTRCTLVFGGDTSLGDRYLLAPSQAAAFARLQQAPMSFFDELQPLIADHDALILNLETVLGEGLTSPFEQRKRWLGQDAPARSVEVLARLGVDAVSLANNHSMDFGAEGMLDTSRHLMQRDILSFGAGSDEAEAALPLLLHCAQDGAPGRAVYIIGALQVSASLRDQYSFFAEGRRAGIHALTEHGICQQIRGLRRAQDNAVIIVFPHWGKNYRWADTALAERAASWIEAGADAVIGHGAHCLQQCAVLPGSAIVHSLGNFVFNSPGRYAEHATPPFSLVARLEIGGDDMCLRLYPILSDNLATGYRPRPASSDEMGQLVQTLREHSAALYPHTLPLLPTRDARGWHFVHCWQRPAFLARG